jgi:bifunctional non-homologous end joining protein LigD
MSDQLHGRTIVPMKGKADVLPRGEPWVYELKWDGMRVLAFITNDETGPSVRLQSTNERDVTKSFPEMQALASLGELFDGLILDGEIVAFSDGMPSFNKLQTRMHVADPSEAARRAKITPVLFVAFDLLHLDGHDIMGLPLTNRRALLEQISDDDPCWTLCEQHTDNVDGLLQAVIDSGLEGIMAKNVNSVYQPNRRSPDWIKIKPRLRQEFVVGGWTEGQGGRTGGLGSLLLGYYDGAELHYAGRAGSGLTEATQREWQSLLGDTASCPFVETPVLPREKKLHWCAPNHVAEIAFSEWGADGQHLRHPVVLGRRTDKDPTTVVREV